VNFSHLNFDEAGGDHHQNLPVHLWSYDAQNVALLPDEVSNWEEVIR
jgi:hypothetical protein